MLGGGILGAGDTSPIREGVIAPDDGAPGCGGVMLINLGGSAPVGCSPGGGITAFGATPGGIPVASEWGLAD